MNHILQICATPGQSVLTVPAGFLPAGMGLRIELAGVPVRYSFNSATSITMGASSLGSQLVDLKAVPQGDIWRDATLDFPSIAAASQSDLTVTVPGASVGDIVDLGLPAAPAAGLVFSAFVSAASVVTVRAMNITAGAIDPASAAYRLRVSKA